jgi:hypothetical protein
MAPVPTLLPDLKFHDLVFGNELGAVVVVVVVSPFACVPVALGRHS